MNEIKKIKKEWGEERWIINESYCGKILLLKRNFRCSLHFHKKKDEVFYVIRGKVLMELGNKKFIMTTKKQPKFYILYTLKGPFELMLRKLLVETCNTDDIRFEKGVVILLQHITEQYLITILTSCAIHMEQNNRDTLLVKDIESTLKILNIPFNSLIA